MFEPSFARGRGKVRVGDYTGAVSSSPRWLSLGPCPGGVVPVMMQNASNFDA